MGMINGSGWFGGIEGTVGNLVLVKRADGCTVVKRKPVRRADFTPGELANQSRFAQAAAYLRFVKATPERYASYRQAARMQDKRACDLAMADFLRAPTIDDIELHDYFGRPGEAIAIRASDDFRVATVRVTVSDLCDVALAAGNAELEETSGVWLFRVSTGVPGGQTVRIRVSVADLAGNEMNKTVDHALPSGT